MSAYLWLQEPVSDEERHKEAESKASKLNSI